MGEPDSDDYLELSDGVDDVTSYDDGGGELSDDKLSVDSDFKLPQKRPHSLVKKYKTLSSNFANFSIQYVTAVCVGVSVCGLAREAGPGVNCLSPTPQ